MVRADRASAGVMFSLDPETGFPHVVVMNAAWGLGENVVQGVVTPDQYPDFAGFLVEAGIDSISLNPDSLVRVKQHVAQVEKNTRRD